MNPRRALLAAPLALLLPRWARAGAQVEEQLADSVRTALAASIADDAPPRPHFEHIEDRLAYLRWLGSASEHLKRRIPEPRTRLEFLQTAWYESHRAGLETALVLGLIQVESGFRKYAISSAGARGYMQVMPFWVQQIGNGDVLALFRLQVNLRFGCTILRHYLDLERGDMTLALGRYNGSRGSTAYPSAVFAMRRIWDPRNLA
ncbi:MAG: lytic transglycosylase domain-containing protein [Burkholderiales bacterium]|nr:lytic transglycosylase domain-containing protein [Burkholderiales bacterium]MDE1925646.1 lytic transglycosylase domain-containing protein [Burkholderiales bacterium]MDE2160600.1 lytic transglycosylase domain-containing protein [Burkholderiales bacterium]MDE2501484.1 lytic transglycosylase domain-containing protein [Burkholderiales bacterium]